MSEYLEVIVYLALPLMGCLVLILQEVDTMQEKARSREVWF